MPYTESVNSYVTTDSNGYHYCTECGRPVADHRGNTPKRLGKCPTPADG